MNLFLWNWVSFVKLPSLNLSQRQSGWPQSGGGGIILPLAPSSSPPHGFACNALWICGWAQTWICRESCNIFPPGTPRWGEEDNQACNLRSPLSSWSFANSLLRFSGRSTLKHCLQKKEHFFPTRASPPTLCLSLSPCLPLSPIRIKTFFCNRSSSNMFIYEKKKFYNLGNGWFFM